MFHYKRTSIWELSDHLNSSCSAHLPDYSTIPKYRNEAPMQVAYETYTCQWQLEYLCYIRFHVKKEIGRISTWNTWCKPDSSLLSSPSDSRKVDASLVLHVLHWGFIELLFAHFTAVVELLTHMFRCELRSMLVDFHSTNRIFCHGFYLLILIWVSIIVVVLLLPITI